MANRMDEGKVIRPLLYVAFMVSTIGLMFALGGAYGAWVGCLAGVLAFGIPAIIAYRTEQERRSLVKEAAQFSGGRGFDVGDNEPPQNTAPFPRQDGS
jgi:hypothetical protein